MAHPLPRAISIEADYDPRLPTEDVAKGRKSLAWWRIGWWSHFPFFFVFILLFVIPS
jgi:hypothetical protein